MQVRVLLGAPFNRRQMNNTFELKIIESPTESDKVFWHGYLDFYENFFKGRSFPVIAEFGLFKGDSIRWLLHRFPEARIYGADILPPQSSWPIDDRVSYFRLDQENIPEIREFLSQNKFDLIIEDGSHIPKHQVQCLIEGMRVLNSGGIYILEDIHTSMRDQNGSNALNILLAIDHYKRINKKIDSNISEKISKHSFFSPEQVLELANSIKKLSLYRRNHLPNRCYNCSSEEFDYASFQCICGVEVFGVDSMSFVIEKT